MAEGNVGDVGIPLGDLAEQMDMKALIAGMDLGYAAHFKSHLNRLSIIENDAIASARRVNGALDSYFESGLRDGRAMQHAQNSVFAGANGARQDSLATTELQTAVADGISAQARLAEEMNRLNTVLGAQRQELGAALSQQQERTAQLENTFSTTLAAILAKLDAATLPSTPVGPKDG